MITERQIKARFQKRHIKKLINLLLSETYNDKPRYNLRPGVTIESILDNIEFSHIERRLKGKYNILELHILIKGQPQHNTLRIMAEDSPWPGWCSDFDRECTPEVVDLFIRRSLDRLEWFVDSTSLSIHF